ncbi:MULTISPECIES: hypothetical protein [unclassified Microcoleus]
MSARKTRFQEAEIPQYREFLSSKAIASQLRVTTMRGNNRLIAIE